MLERHTAASGAVILGAGTPLFEAVGRHRLRQVGVEISPVATHLTYDVLTAS